MSDDIVKRLLRANGYDILREEPIYVNPDGPKAADEIERLRAELAAEREAHEETLRLRYCAEDDAATLKEQYDALLSNSEAERDALREALAFYAQHSVYTTNTVYMGGEHVETAIERDGGNRARAALNKGGTNAD